MDNYVELAQPRECFKCYESFLTPSTRRWYDEVRIPTYACYECVRRDEDEQEEVACKKCPNTNAPQLYHYLNLLPKRVHTMGEKTYADFDRTMTIELERTLRKEQLALKKEEKLLKELREKEKKREANEETRRKEKVNEEKEKEEKEKGNEKEVKNVKEKSEEKEVEMEEGKGKRVKDKEGRRKEKELKAKGKEKKVKDKKRKREEKEVKAKEEKEVKLKEEKEVKVKEVKLKEEKEVNVKEEKEVEVKEVKAEEGKEIKEKEVNSKQEGGDEEVKEEDQRGDTGIKREEEEEEEEVEGGTEDEKSEEDYVVVEQDHQEGKSEEEEEEEAAARGWFDYYLADSSRLLLTAVGQYLPGLGPAPADEEKIEEKRETEEKIEKEHQKKGEKEDKKEEKEQQQGDSEKEEIRIKAQEKTEIKGEEEELEKEKEKEEEKGRNELKEEESENEKGENSKGEKEAKADPELDQKKEEERFYMSHEWFDLYLARAVPIINHVAELVTKEEQFRRFHLEWTGMAPYLRRVAQRACFSDLAAEHYIGVLKLTAATERIFRMLYVEASEGGAPPFLFRDLLRSNVIVGVLGKSMMELMVALCGSVDGLNLRNLAWHGFLAERDIYRSHCVGLLYALHNCASYAHKYMLEDVDSSYLVTSKMEEGFSSKLIQNFDFDFESVLDVVERSALVSKGTRNLWKHAFLLYKQRDQDCLLLFLPLLENALRVIYCSANCQARMLSASTSEFYVTFTDLLDMFFCSAHDEVPDKTLIGNSKPGLFLNLVPQYLGRHLCAALGDLFLHRDGPRLRDRVSHGEVVSDEIPFELISQCCALSFLALSAETWRFYSPYEKVFNIGCVCDYVFLSKIVVVPEWSKILKTQCHYHYPMRGVDVLKQNLPRLNKDRLPLGSTDGKTKVQYQSLHGNCISSPESFDFGTVVVYLSDYQYYFQASSLVYRQLIKTINSIKDWQTWIAPHPLENEDRVTSERIYDMGLDDGDDFEEIVWLTQFGCHKTFNLKTLCSSDFDASKLYRAIINYLGLFLSRLEVSMLQGLRSILVAIDCSISNIRSSLASHYNLHVSKTMRSRQRESYARQLRETPIILVHFVYIINLVFYMYSINPKWRTAPPSQVPVFQRLLKEVLKTVENLKTFTKPNVNKYRGATASLTECTAHCETFFEVQGRYVSYNKVHT